jgi:hypothetical protein
MTHPTLRPGDRLGPYEIEAELGRGGAGVVVAARAVEPVAGPPHVAIKARLAADGPGAARFQREIGALRALRVPGTVRLHSAGQAGPIAWFSMDRVEGQDLRERAAACADEATRGALVARLAVTLLETLAGVHQRGFVHRDLKPGNVLVDGTDRVWLLDFGVARGWRSPTAALTRPGTVVGTLPYMAPEQVSGQSTGPEVDMFAAGLLLHEAMAGPREPARVPQEWLARQCLERLVPLGICAPGCPPELSNVVDAMLAFAPEDRPTAAEAAERLRMVTGGVAQAPLRPTPPRFVGRDAIIEAATAASRATAPTLFALEGPAGSGRRRTIEQIRRRLLLRGVVGRRMRVRAHAPGAALGRLLAELLESRPARPEDAAALAVVWPELPDAPPPDSRAEQRRIARAAARVLADASQDAPLVLEIREAQDMGVLLADTLRELAREAPPDVLVLLAVDDRWGGDGWARLQRRTPPHSLVRHRLPDLTQDEAHALAAALGCPEAARAGSPLGAAEAAWEAIARRTATPRTTLPWALLPLALMEGPVDDAVVRGLGLAPDALAQQGLLRGAPEHGWDLADEAVRTLAHASIADRRRAAARLLPALDAADPELRARALHTSGADALDAAVAAAEHCMDAGRGADARAWLMLADTLPRPEGAAARGGAFRRAAARTRVSLGTDRGPAREDLVAQAERRATTDPERLEAALLRAELHWRQGDRAMARTELDAVAGEATRAAPALATRTRVRRAALELDAGQPAAALRACERTRGPDGRLPATIIATEHRAALWTGEPERALVPPTTPALAARAQLLLGRPAAARAGLEPAWTELLRSRTADRAEARLLLARLEIGDGRAAVAARILDGLQLPPDSPAWLPPDRDAVRLLLALSQADISAGDRLAAEPPACLPPDWAPLAVRWWRLRGAPAHGEPALQAAAARMPGTWGQAIADTLRAWLALAAGRPEPAARAAERARDAAARAGIGGVGRQARMLLAAARAESDAAWSYLSARGARSRDPVAHLDALELDAIRRLRRDDREGAARTWARLARVAGPSGWRMRTHHARRQLDRLQRGADGGAVPSTLRLDEV